MNYFNNDIKVDYNFDFMKDYFQSEEITTVLHSHLKDKMKNIIDKNPYKERYNNNNDIFIHIRLTDTKRDGMIGINYYIHCINLLKYDNIYIGSDDFNDDFIKKIKTLYPKVIFVNKNPI